MVGHIRRLITKVDNYIYDQQAKEREHQLVREGPQVSSASRIYWRILTIAVFSAVSLAVIWALVTTVVWWTSKPQVPYSVTDNMPASAKYTGLRALNMSQTISLNHSSAYSAWFLQHGDESVARALEWYARNASDTIITAEHLRRSAMEFEEKARNLVARTAEKVVQQEWLQSISALDLQNATLTSLQRWALRNPLTTGAAAYLGPYPPREELSVIFHDTSSALATLFAVDLGRHMTAVWPRLESSLAHQNKILGAVTNLVSQERDRHKDHEWCTKAGLENTCTQAKVDFFLESGKEEEVVRWRKNIRVVRATKERYLLLKRYVESEALASEVVWSREARAYWDLLREAATYLSGMARVDSHGDDVGIWNGPSLEPAL